MAVDGALAGLLGLVVGLLFATLREVMRPTVAQPAAGARELGAVLLGNSEENAAARSSGSTRTCPSASAWPRTGPGSSPSC